MSIDNNSATDPSMQGVVDRIQGALFPEEPVVADDDEVLDDGEDLPEGDDSDSEEDEGSDEVVEATDEEISLAAALGIDEERLIVGDDGQISFNAIIDGETKTVPLKELAASYQLQGHVNNKSIALENQRKEFETARAQAVQEIMTRAEGAEALAKLLEQQLIGDYQSIDWNTLRATDPSEWSALRQEYAEKAQKIQEAQALLGQERKRAIEEQQRQFHESQSKNIAEERAKLLAKNPEWVDSAKRKAALEEMKTFISSTYGFAPEDMETVTDHRLIEIIKDAQKYRAGIKAAEVKKVKVVPKFQKPGATRQQASTLAKARDIKAKKAAVRKSGGSVQSIANALIDRM